jgi:hypothetical protein
MRGRYGQRHWEANGSKPCTLELVLGLWEVLKICQSPLDQAFTAVFTQSLPDILVTYRHNYGYYQRKTHPC